MVEEEFSVLKRNSGIFRRPEFPSYLQPIFSTQFLGFIFATIIAIKDLRHHSPTDILVRSEKFLESVTCRSEKLLESVTESVKKLLFPKKYLHVHVTVTNISP